MNFARHYNARLFSFAAIGFFLLAAPHCQDFFERDTTIEMDGKNPPTFTFSGNGQVSSIVVMDLSPSDVSIYDARRVMWEIVPTGDPTPSRFPKITFGVLPSGFSQKVPANGSPPALAEEKPYRVSAPTSNANAGTLMFLIRHGQTLRVEQADDLQYYVQTPTP
jgi:hypothetical protein